MANSETTAHLARQAHFAEAKYRALCRGGRLDPLGRFGGVVLAATATKWAWSSHEGIAIGFAAVMWLGLVVAALNERWIRRVVE